MKKIYFEEIKKMEKEIDELQKEEKIWNIKKKILDKRNIIKKEKFDRRFKINWPTSKLLIAFLFINCSLIELFTCWITARMLTIALETGGSIDFTPLVTLIGTVTGEVIGYAIYSLKATKENTKGGIVYESALKSYDDNALG